MYFENLYNKVINLEINKERLFSATHEEILSGLTSDIYFIKSAYLLEKINKIDTEVVAEFFSNNYGVFAGLPEVLFLLKDKQVEIESLKEGDEFEPYEVVMRLRGRYSQFGYLETAILGILASSSNWATAARLCKNEAKDKIVLAFGARFVHPSIAPVMERASLIGGVDDVSCILGAKLYNKQPKGTMPHAFIIILNDTLEAAKLYDQFVEQELPRIVLVDTFKDEVEEAIRIAKYFKEIGKELYAIRLDTPKERGRVTPELVKEVRAKLDLEGFNNVKIVVSGGLDPERIRILNAAGADIFGVGFFIATYNKIQMTMDLKMVQDKPITKRGRIPGITHNPKLQKIKSLLTNTP